MCGLGPVSLFSTHPLSSSLWNISESMLTAWRHRADRGSVFTVHVAGERGGLYTCSRSSLPSQLIPQHSCEGTDSFVELTAPVPTKEGPVTSSCGIDCSYPHKGRALQARLGRQLGGCTWAVAACTRAELLLLHELAQSPLHPSESPPANPLGLLHPMPVLPSSWGTASFSLLANWLEKEEKGHALFCCLCQFPRCQYSQGSQFKLQTAEQPAHKTPEYLTISSQDPLCTSTVS